MAKKNIYTVKQINSYIRNMFSQDFLLSSVSIKGEVSNCKYHNSGHIYFTIKDDGAAISCIMFASKRANLKFRMSDGDQVVVTGNVDVYERDGKYQLYANSVESAGLGALYERYEALKKELEEQGMFDPSYKRPIPGYIKTLGVVTAPDGAAVRDIIQIARRRNPYIQIILYPARVQGDGAGASIIRGLKALSDYGVDVIIAGRGGGSIEDLWAFNEPEVARAIFDCEVPVISAVGHETDTTIADFVADLRAPTPSAAAELAVYSYESFLDDIYEKKAWLKGRMDKKLQRARSLVDFKKDTVKRLSPLSRINRNRTDLLRYEERLSYSIGRKLFHNRHRMELIAQKLKALSPLDRISGGYGMITGPSGRAVKSIRDIKKGDGLTIYIRDGRIEARAESISKIDNIGE